MARLTDDLPPEDRALLDPDFLANEEAYLRMRDRLLPQYGGRWVAVKDGGVIASGDELVRVMDQAAGAGGHPFYVRVGEEDEPVFVVRREPFQSRTRC